MFFIDGYQLFVGDGSVQEDDTFDWPRHRGNAALQGLQIYIGTKLTLDWIFETGVEYLKSSVVIHSEKYGSAKSSHSTGFKDEVIIVGSYDNFVHCMDAKSGKGLWKFETQNYVNGVPTIFDQKYVVFGGCDSMLYVIDLETGKEIRSLEVEAPIAASVAVADGVGYVGNMDRAVMAFDLTNGNQVWSYKEKNFPYFSSPALSETSVFIGGRDKGLHAIDRVSGKQQWRFSAKGRVDIPQCWQVTPWYLGQ